MCFITLVTNMNFICINKFNNAFSFCMQLNSCITCSFCLQSSSNNRSIWFDQWNCLTLHVRSHQCTVGIVMLKEWNQRCTQTNNLVGSNVHEFHFIRLENREITCLSSFYFIFCKLTLFCKRYVRLCNLSSILFFSTQVSEFLHFYLSIVYFAVRRFDESHLIDLCMYAKRRDQTNVWTFWRFNGTQTSVV